MQSHIKRILILFMAMLPFVVGAQSKLQHIDSIACCLESCASLDCHNNDRRIETCEFYAGVLDDYDRELSIYLPVLEYSKQHYGELHEISCNLYNKIGSLYSLQGKDSLALGYYERLLSIQKEILEPEHPDVGVTYGNIALIYYAQGNNSLALDYFKRSLPILEKAFGEDAFSTVMVYANIGIIYYSLGENVLALEYLNKSLNPLREYLGKYHDFIENIEAIIDDIS